MIRVLLADDQALVRAGFRLIVNGEPDLEVVGEAVNGEEAVAAAAELGPDVVLLTYRLDGVERPSLRSSVWVRAEGRWVLLFHQGTPTSPSD